MDRRCLRLSLGGGGHSGRASGSTRIGVNATICDAHCASCRPYHRDLFGAFVDGTTTGNPPAFEHVNRRVLALMNFGQRRRASERRASAHNEAIGIRFPLPLHVELHLRRVCCLRWGECVKWFSTVQSQDPKEGALNRERSERDRFVHSYAPHASGGLGPAHVLGSWTLGSLGTRL